MLHDLEVIPGSLEGSRGKAERAGGPVLVELEVEAEVRVGTRNAPAFGAGVLAIEVVER